MKIHSRDDNGHVVYDMTAESKVAQRRKQVAKQTKKDTETIKVLNRQVRRALDSINKLEERIQVLEGAK